MSQKSDYICGTQNANTKEMNQTQHAPFAEQKKKPTTEHIMVCQERNNTYIIYGMKMERAGKK